MAGHQKDSLRRLTFDERLCLEQVSHSHTPSAAEVARARELPPVADGAGFEGAARAAGRKSEDAVVVENDVLHIVYHVDMPETLLYGKEGASIQGF